MKFDTVFNDFRYITEKGYLISEDFSGIIAILLIQPAICFVNIADVVPVNPVIFPAQQALGEGPKKLLQQ